MKQCILFSLLIMFGTSNAAQERTPRSPGRRNVTQGPKIGKNTPRTKAIEKLTSDIEKMRLNKPLGDQLVMGVESTLASLMAQREQEIDPWGLGEIVKKDQPKNGAKRNLNNAFNDCN